MRLLPFWDARVAEARYARLGQDIHVRHFLVRASCIFRRARESAIIALGNVRDDQISRVSVDHVSLNTGQVSLFVIQPRIVSMWSRSGMARQGCLFAFYNFVFFFEFINLRPDVDLD